jgi:hypothetical protein
MTIGTTLTDACTIHLGEKIGRVGKQQRTMVLPNPEFVEWLMRWPGAWSKLDSPESVMGKIQSQRQQRSPSCSPPASKGR